MYAHCLYWVSRSKSLSIKRVIKVSVSALLVRVFDLILDAGFWLVLTLKKLTPVVQRRAKGQLRLTKCVRRVRFAASTVLESINV
jgi:hypothetical protein